MSLNNHACGVNALLRAEDTADAARLSPSTTAGTTQTVTRASTPLAESLRAVRGDRLHTLDREGLSPLRALDGRSWRGIRLGERWVVEARVQSVGPRYIREVWMYVGSGPAWLVADDDDPAPYGRGYVDDVIAEINRRGGALVVERRRMVLRLDGPARGGWVTVFGGAR